MKIDPGIVGQASGPERVAVDKRWLMAYNAALGEVSAAPHPLFPVCYEWDATRALRISTGLQKLNARLVHAQHDLTIHRQVREENLAVSARVLSVSQRKPGAFVVIRLEARGTGGDPVSTSDYGMLYRGVTLEGGDRAVETAGDPPPHEKKLEKTGEIRIAATAAHVYTECARIWNPIHTDPEYARDAGLPGIILHGTATLAFSISELTKALGVKPLRIRCRFAGMVLMPSRLGVFASRQGASVAFETRTERGDTVIERGWMIG